MVVDINQPCRRIWISRRNLVPKSRPDSGQKKAEAKRHGQSCDASFWSVFGQILGSISGPFSGARNSNQQAKINK